VEVRKNSSTASSANDGEFDTSTTTAAPLSTSASPSPVRVFTPVFGAAGTASWPCSRSLATSFDPISPAHRSQRPSRRIPSRERPGHPHRVATGRSISRPRFTYRCPGHITPAAGEAPLGRTGSSAERGPAAFCGVPGAGSGYSWQDWATGKPSQDGERRCMRDAGPTAPIP
jgi:hypothetical protein